MDVLRLLLLHQLEELLGLLRGEVRDDVRRLVRRHLLDDVGRLLLVHLGDEVRLDLRLELVEGFRRGLRVELLEEILPLLGGQVAHDLGEVRGVEVRHRLARHRQRQPVELRLHRLEELPGDQLVAQGVADRLEEGPPAALDAQPPQDPPHPHVDVGDVGRAPLLGELHVVHPHDLRAVDVDDLLVEEVLADEEVLLRGSRLRDLPFRLPGGDDPLVEDGELLPGEVARRFPFLDEQADGPREPRPRLHGDILDAPDLLAPRVEDDLSEDVADVHLPDERHLPFPLSAPFHKYGSAGPSRSSVRSGFEQGQGRDARVRGKIQSFREP